MSLPTKLAKRLKIIRGKQTQGEFSRKLGISRATLNRLESATQNATLKTLEQLTKSLKCSISDLFK
jgi:DNA-binding Xre family transcriptional regulator